MPDQDPSPAADAGSLHDAAAASDGGTQDGATANALSWHPGYYVVTQNDPQVKAKLVADPILQSFQGAEFRYGWAASEKSKGNYSAGFAELDKDLAALHAKNKKLLMFLDYKEASYDDAVPSDCS